MLVQFTVGNYLSFQKDTTFSMRATSDTRHPNHVVAAPTSSGKATATLRAAAIYGANAAGKSNLVLAMAFAQKLILEGTRGETSIGVRPFKLDRNKKPSRFEFMFRHEGTPYSYGFAADSRRVHEEWLFATPGKRESRLFERVTHEDGKVEAELGPSLRRAEGGAFLDFVAQGTRPNQLFLTECAERNVEAVKPVMDWFRDVLMPIRAESRYAHLPMQARFNKSFQQFLGDFLRAAGTGIEGLETREIPVDWERHYADMEVADREELERDVMTLEPKEGFIVMDGQGRRSFLVRGASGKACLLVVRTVHHTATGQAIRFRLEDESEGTQRLVHLLPALFMLKRGPKVLVVDELDRRLHTLLARLFLQQALECGEDDPQGQIIFTTHDTNLLDLDLLRRDEIWFIEKDPGGATHLASLAEWKVRPDLEIEKSYLTGRFGAIPFFGDLSRLCAHDESDDEAEQPATDLEAAEVQTA